MNRNPLLVVLLLLWRGVVLIGSSVKALVRGILTFFLRTLPRLRRDVQDTSEMDFRLAERLRRDGL